MSLVRSSAKSCSVLMFCVQGRWVVRSTKLWTSTIDGKQLLPLFMSAALALPTPQAQPQEAAHDAAPVEITHFDNYLTPSGYTFGFSTSDGTSRHERGQFRTAGSGPEGNHALSVQGSYAYVAPDGTQYNVAYVADENGYRLQNEQSQEQHAQNGKQYPQEQQQYLQTPANFIQPQEQHLQTQEQYVQPQEQYAQTQEQTFGESAI